MSALRPLILGLLLAAGAVPAALGCACEIECKDGEEYSDEEEMCVPVPVS